MKTAKNNVLSLIAIAMLFWVPFQGCASKGESAPEANHENVEGNSGSDASPGGLVAEPVRADSSAARVPVTESPEEWKTYRGEYFDVQYPGSFTVESSGETDGILFAAPDRSVRFYIFSPLWNGESKHYEIDPELEIVKQHSVEREGPRRITRITYQDRENHHLRSFEDVEDTLLNTRRIFGVFYTNQDSYSHYKDLYLKFKRSLRQYAD